MRYKKYITYLFINTLIVVGLTTCKKYPENNLWFKNPARAVDGQWRLVFFEMNGSDSLNTINVSLIRDKKITFKLSGSSRLINKSKAGSISVADDSNFSGGWYLDYKSKHISIYFVNDKYEYYANDPSCTCYHFNNIFATFRERVQWDIEKLTRHEFWITTNYNNIFYELHFEK